MRRDELGPIRSRGAARCGRGGLPCWRETIKLYDSAGLVTEGDSATLYDGGGFVKGTAHATGDVTKLRDPAGRCVESTRTEGGTAVLYDCAGHRVGSAARRPAGE